MAAALTNQSRSCKRLWATENAAQRLGSLIGRRGLEVERAIVRELDRRLGSDVVHQGVCLEVGALPDRDLADLLPTSAAGPGETKLLILDQIEDPRNLGAILRSAAALAVTGVILPRRGSAPLSGACAKAASGALDLVPIVEVANLAQALEAVKERGVWTIGLDGEAATPLEALPTYPSWALVLGAEGKGLRRLTAERCDQLARLSIEPQVQSLNVSVAAGIALYCLVRTSRPS